MNNKTEDKMNTELKTKGTELNNRVENNSRNEQNKQNRN